VLGVDLVYCNLRNKTLVMVQYKMLEPQPNAAARGSLPDWTYRPDRQLAREIGRMKRFHQRFADESDAYRLNSSMFYLKFVKRDAVDTTAAITIPLEHFEHVRAQHGRRRGKGAMKISYKDLNGAYLRDSAFFDLIRSGYIGSSEAATAQLTPLIRALLNGDRAVVVAVQKAMLDHEVG
jgi:hypothetical protein